MSSPPPARGDDVVAAYVGNYLVRLRRSGESVFPSAEATALAGLLLGELRTTTRGATAAAFLARDHDLVTRPDPARASDATTNLRALAWLAGRPDPDAGILAELVTAGGDPAATGSTVALAWRLLLLARTQAITAAVLPELETAADRLAGWAARVREGGADTQVAARVAYACAEAAACVDAPAAAEAARTLGGLLGELALPDVGPTSVLAQVALAARACALPDLRAAALGALERRLDPARDLAWQDETREKYDFSPWVPLALLGDGTPAAVEAVLDPPAAPLPAFHVIDVTTDGGGLMVRIDDAGEAATRTVTHADLDLLLARILDVFGAMETSPRQHAHSIIALEELAAQEVAPATRSRIDTLLARSLDVVVAGQQANGGWFYGHRAVPSVVYAAATESTTEFPDLQYTIDAAVPGVALCLAYRRTGDVAHLARAREALRFFEQAIGRVEVGGRHVWRLFPEDEKTARMGTAVNYELWAGLFFAWLWETDEDPGQRQRLRGYLEDILDYTAGHLGENGDIAYGDYVSEVRTAYASWDAYLLREIAGRTGIERAAEMGERIAGRLAELVLPSGIVPNVADHAEAIGDLQRWTVHRHGIGPYPVRSYYQCYFVTAAASSPAARPAAARALAYTLVDLYDTHLAYLRWGLDGRGEPDERVGPAPGDWPLLALVALPSLLGLRHRFDHAAVDAPATRAQRLLRDMAARARRAVGALPADSRERAEAEEWLARGEAALAGTSELGAPDGVTGTTVDARAFAALDLRRAGADPAAADRAVTDLLVEHRTVDGVPGVPGPPSPTRALHEARTFAALAGQGAELAGCLEREHRRLLGGASPR